MRVTYDCDFCGAKDLPAPHCVTFTTSQLATEVDTIRQPGHWGRESYVVAYLCCSCFADRPCAAVLAKTKDKQVIRVG